MDREKVIIGLECHRIDNNHRINCADCPYYVDDDNHIRCVNDLHDDAIALLKEQEHKDRMFHALEDEWKRLKELLKEQEAEMSYRKAKAITHTATKLDDATCPSCGNVVGEKQTCGERKVFIQWKYCIFCGQKLDWEGR